MIKDTMSKFIEGTNIEEMSIEEIDLLTEKICVETVSTVRQHMAPR